MGTVGVVIDNERRLVKLVEWKFEGALYETTKMVSFEKLHEILMNYKE